MTNYQCLERVYDTNTAERLIPRIDQLVEKYTGSNRQCQVGHEDVLLITYGDSVLSADLSPLPSLHRFLNTYADAFTSVHILPFFPYTSDDGFSVTDYRQINPELGTWQDVSELAADYQLMFDAVINHISSESEWVQGHLNDRKAVLGFVLEADPTLDWSKVVRPRTSPLFHEFEKADGQKTNLWTTFSRDQVDLNYANPELLLEILDILLDYVSKGASLIRLDAIGFMWKEPGTTCIHHPKTHLLIQLMNNVLAKVNPSVKLVTETNVPHVENISYFGDGTNEAHMVYNFTLPPLMAYSILSGDPEKLVTWAKTLELPSDQVCFFNFLSSHDGIGVRPVQGILDDSQLQILMDACESNGGSISLKSNPDGTSSPYEINCNYYSLLQGSEQETGLAVKRMLLAHAFLLSFPGLPAIYIHSLVGSKNDLEGMQRSGQNRTINREKLKWEVIDAELSDSDHPRNNIYQPLKELIAAKKSVVAFDPYGDFNIELVDEALVRLDRKTSKGNVACYYNFSKQKTSRELTGNWLNLLSDRQPIGSVLELEGYGFAWLLEG